MSGTRDQAPHAGARSIAGNTALLTAAQAVGVAARLVYVILVARLLGPEAYALLAYAQSWYLAFLPVALFGLGTTVVYSIGGDRAQAPAIAAQALGIRIVTTLVAAVACIGLGWLIAPDPRGPALITVLTVALVGRAVNAWAQHLFAAFEVNRIVLRQELTFRLIDLATAATVLLAGGGVMALALAQALVWLLQAAWSLRVVRRELVPLRIAWPPVSWAPLASMALPFFITGLAVDWRVNGPLVMFRNVTADAVLFGQFALAMQALFIASTLPQSLWTAAQPVLRRAVVRGDGKDLLFAGVMQRIAFVAGAGAGLTGLAIGPPLFRMLFGAGFVTAGHLVGLTLWCLIPLLAGTAFPPVLVARGYFRFQALASVAGAAVMTLLLPPLAGAFGAEGAIAAAALGFALPPVIIYAFALRAGWTSVISTLVRPLATVVLGLGSYLLLAPYSAWLALACSLLTLLALSFLLGVISRDERTFLLTVWQERRLAARA